MVSPALDGRITVVTNIGGKAGNRKFVRDAFARSLGLGDFRSREGRVAFQEIVNKVCELAADGDLEAAKIVFDRLDGKPARQLTVGGEDDDRLVAAAITSNMSASEASRLYRERLKTIGGEVIEDAGDVVGDAGVVVASELPLLVGGDDVV